MSPPFKSTLPKAAQPKHGRNFDPWNSVALGHQRAETRGPGGWRENRTYKLHSQLSAGNTGGQRLSDAVGAGSEDHDEERKALLPKEVRAHAANSVMDMLRKPGTMSSLSSSSSSSLPSKGRAVSAAAVDRGVKKSGPQQLPEDKTSLDSQGEQGDVKSAANQDGSNGSGIFDGLVIYVNGSTHPLVSDHKLKHLLVENGARMSIHLGRRQVSHVILGKPSGPNGGAGGGLAGGKLEKEIRRIGGCGVKYVGVEW